MEALKKATFFLFVIFVLFLFVWALFVPKAEISQKIAQIIKTQSEKSDLFFQGVTLQEIADGVKYWEIKAKTSDINKSQKTAVLKESRGTFFESGRPGLKFISPEILWQMDKKEIYMKTPLGFDAKSEKKIASLISDPRKNIFSLPDHTGNGYYFKAHELKWRLKDRQIFCRGEIEIRKGDLIGSAEKLRSDVKLERVFLEGKPQITIISPQLVTIEALYFEVLSPKSTIFAKGNVLISTNHTAISAPELVYNQKESQVNLQDKVAINYKNIRATGKSAKYDIKTRLVTLKEEVRLVEGQSVLTGDTITYSLENNKFKIYGKSRAVIPGKNDKY